MKAFEWSPLFETGLAEVDAQHRRLVELVNDLGERIDSGDAERIDATLTALAEYTIYHFGCEERLMAEAGIDLGYAESHRITHRRFVEQVQEWLSARHAQGQIGVRQLLDFLANWLIFHILGDDQSMGRQIAAIGKGVAAGEALAKDKASDDPRTEILLGGLRRLYADLVERNDKLVAAQRSLREMNTTLEQRVLERTAELLAANERLKAEQERAIEAEKMASLGRLVAGFAHEVNTPVGVAIGAVSQADEVAKTFAKLLMQDEVTEEAINEQLHQLEEANELAMANLRRAAQLVQSFKRTAVDQSSEERRDYHLAEVIDDVVHNLRPIFKRTNIDFAIRCPADLRLHGVPGAMSQILTNLCVNAHVHAFQEGARAGTIVITATYNGGQVDLRFADDGEGMEAASLEKIFEPFYTTRRNRGGSGLGLYLVYNLVTLTLGGSIVCSSTPGAGTEFRISFPSRQLPPTGHES